MALEKIVVPDNETEEQKAERLRKEQEEAEKKAAEEAAQRAKEEEEARKKAEEEAARKKAEEGDDDNKIIIDDVEYKLDENGNALNEDGSVKFTKEEIEKMSSENEDDDNEGLKGDYLEEISKLTGIIIKDDKGKTMKFDSTIEGFAQRESAVKALGEREGFTKGFNEFLKQNPDIAALIDYKNRFGTIEGYSANQDYSKLEIKDDNDFLADLIYKAEIQKGTSAERAKRLVEFAKMNNTLKEDATEALTWLKKNQQAEVDRYQNALKEQAEQDRRKEIAFYGVTYEDDKVVVHQAEGSLYDMVVKKGQIGDYAIPTEGIRVKTDNGEKLLSREELFDYFSRPAIEVEGMVYSQAQYDAMLRLNNPKELALHFIMNLTGGLDQLVDSTITKRKIHEIKRLKSVSSKQTGAGPKQKKTGGNDRIVLPVK